MNDMRLLFLLKYVLQQVQVYVMIVRNYFKFKYFSLKILQASNFDFAIVESIDLRHFQSICNQITIEKVFHVNC